MSQYKLSKAGKATAKKIEKKMFSFAKVGEQHPCNCPANHYKTVFDHAETCPFRIEAERRLSLIGESVGLGRAETAKAKHDNAVSVMYLYTGWKQSRGQTL